jgi:hypothetical protein
MKLSSAPLLFLALQAPLFAHAADVLPAQLPTAEDSRLLPVATSPHIWNGVTVAPDGRTFVSLNPKARAWPNRRLSTIPESGCRPRRCMPGSEHLHS